MSYQLYTDATADFCPEMAAPYAEIKVIPMELTVGEEPHEVAFLLSVEE